MFRGVEHRIENFHIFKQNLPNQNKNPNSQTLFLKMFMTIETFIYGELN